MAPPKKNLKPPKARKLEPEGDMMKRFHEKDICQIIPTSPMKKEDVFDSFRPKTSKEYLNYNISQTDAKMDAGPTKIHVQQTRVEYEPYPPGYVFYASAPVPSPKRKKRTSHGRGPVWLFLDEEWKRKVDREQIQYKQEMEERITRKVKMLRKLKNAGHDQMLKHVGPDWFQELSPDQMTAVDLLQCSILKDLAKNSITHTQECLARLGLVLRPNHRHIEIALRNCCESAIEFLLYLYQLIRPDRKCYNLNDRLLLSAVVHLSMRPILRELHIRIPSPPPIPKPKNPDTKVKKPYVKYKSPYLVPYTFVPEPQKHTGIYENRHIQYPESPYFSYLDELRKDIDLENSRPWIEGRSGFSGGEGESIDNIFKKMSLASTVFSELEREVEEEYIIAQKVYDEVRGEYPKRLLKPSIYKTCDRGIFAVVKPEYESQCVGGDSEIVVAGSEEDSLNFDESNSSGDIGGAGIEVVTEGGGTAGAGGGTVITGGGGAGGTGGGIGGGIGGGTGGGAGVGGGNTGGGGGGGAGGGSTGGGGGGIGVVGGGGTGVAGGGIGGGGGSIGIAGGGGGGTGGGGAGSIGIAGGGGNKGNGAGSIGITGGGGNKGEGAGSIGIAGGGATGGGSAGGGGGATGGGGGATGGGGGATGGGGGATGGGGGATGGGSTGGGGGATGGGSTVGGGGATDGGGAATGGGGGAIGGGSTGGGGGGGISGGGVGGAGASSIGGGAVGGGGGGAGGGSIGGGGTGVGGGGIGGGSTGGGGNIGSGGGEGGGSAGSGIGGGGIEIGGTGEGGDTTTTLPCTCTKRKKGKCRCEKKRKKKEEELMKELENKCTCWPEPVPDLSSSTISISTIGSFVKVPSESEEETERPVEVKPPRSYPCGCKPVVEMVLDFAQKQVESAQNKKKPKSTFVIADTKLGEEEDAVPIPIIAAVKPERKCDCLEKYWKKIGKYEELKTRQEVQDTLKSANKKFVIGGVSTGPDGKPVYILSGTAGPKPCKKCEEMLEMKRREQERIANMPDTSPKFPKNFVISGVQNTPVGNVYVLSGVAPTKECECMKLYHAYMDKHAACMELYERYVQKMNREAQEYLSELTGDEEEYEDMGEEEENFDMFPQPDDAEEEEANSEQQNEEDEGSMFSGELEQFDRNCYGCGGANFFDDYEDDSQDRSYAKRFLNMEEFEVKEEGEGRHVNLKRYVILPKLPCQKKKQLAIIEHSLQSMARDGYPLAKLPDAYKLPHFKLWMDLRCGKFWTQQDRVAYNFKSKNYWHHLDVCKTHIKSPRLKMTNERAWKYTWASAKYIKKITADLIENHCRTVKQGIIDDGREFFPSMFDYEFPTNTFRDCYFAYIPGKEEAVFSYRPWKVFEFVDYKLIRIKNAKKCQR